MQDDIRFLLVDVICVINCSFQLFHDEIGIDISCHAKDFPRKIKQENPTFQRCVPLLEDVQRGRRLTGGKLVRRYHKT